MIGCTNTASNKNHFLANYVHSLLKFFICKTEEINMYFVRYTKEIYYHTRLFLEKKVLSRSWYFISIFSEHIFIYGSSFNLRMITCSIIYAKILSKVIWSLYSLNTSWLELSWTRKQYYTYKLPWLKQ